jgi:hypothetical protein
MAGWDLSEVKGRGGATGLLDVGVFRLLLGHYCGIGNIF